MTGRLGLGIGVDNVGAQKKFQILFGRLKVILVSSGCVNVILCLIGLAILGGFKGAGTLNFVPTHSTDEQTFGKISRSQAKNIQ